MVADIHPLERSKFHENEEVMRLTLVKMSYNYLKIIINAKFCFKYLVSDKVYLVIKFKESAAIILLKEVRFMKMMKLCTKLVFMNKNILWKL